MLSNEKNKSRTITISCNKEQTCFAGCAALRLLGKRELTLFAGIIIITMKIYKKIMIVKLCSPFNTSVTTSIIKYVINLTQRTTYPRGLLRIKRRNSKRHSKSVYVTAVKTMEVLKSIQRMRQNASTE